MLARYPALAGVDLDVVQGEALLLTGPNGAGKSTLLRLLAGLVPLTAGEGAVLGHDLTTGARALRRSVAFLGHETHCYDDLTVRENLRFHARAAGRGTGAADAALERVGLGRQADVTQRVLSAGQRRRLALGVVLAREAPLLLLDEPHAGLDAAGRQLLDGLVGDATAAGHTVVLASHELDLARAVADREVAMAGGQVLAGTLAPDAAPGPGAEAPAAPEPPVASGARRGSDAP